MVFDLNHLTLSALNNSLNFLQSCKTWVNKTLLCSIWNYSNYQRNEGGDKRNVNLKNLHNGTVIVFIFKIFKMLKPSN